MTHPALCGVEETVRLITTNIIISCFFGCPLRSRDIPASIWAYQALSVFGQNTTRSRLGPGLCSDGEVPITQARVMSGEDLRQAKSEDAATLKPKRVHT